MTSPMEITKRLLMAGILLALFVAFNGQETKVLISMLAYVMLMIMFFVIMTKESPKGLILAGGKIMPDIIAGAMVGGIFIFLNNLNSAFSLGAPAALLNLGEAGIILSIVFVAPLAEEIGFRGWLFPRVIKKSVKSDTLAIIIQALIFASFHYAAYGGWLGLTNAPGLFLGAFVFGVVAGALVNNDPTGLEKAIVAHMIFNAYLLNLTLQFI